MNFLWLSTVIVCLAIGYSFGFHTRDAQDKFRELATKVKEKKAKDQATPKTAIIERPLTPEEQILRDHEEMLERLNA